VTKLNPDLSVVICAHNPREDYLERTLSSLRAQTLPYDQWELILVDNASTSELGNRVDLDWHHRGRHVREMELGLTPARLRGISESASNIIVFVDDDNVLDPNYLFEVLAIGREWPQLGAWGGSLVPEFEEEPSQEVRPFLRVLALREIDAPRWSNVDACYQAQPWGAGLCIRREVATAYQHHYRSSRIQLSDRRGKSLTSSGDSEICYLACSIGYGMGVFPQLKITHLMPKARVEVPYILRMTQSLRASNMVLHFKWHGAIPPSPFSPTSLWEAAKALVRKRGVERQIFFANRRAVVDARRIIQESRGSSLSTATTSKATQDQ
jgi:glycosyltransferase involved in cell wall biosynthesis